MCIRDSTQGCIRDAAHAYSQEGGLAVLYGNLAEDGCVVKTAGVDAAIPVSYTHLDVYKRQQ